MRTPTLLRPLATAAALVFAALPAQSQTKWDMPTGYPIGNPHTVTLTQWAKDVDAATKGQLKIVVHANGSLFKAPEIMRAVESGQAQVGEVLMSLLANQNPVFALDSLPFLATGFDDAWRLYQAQRPVLERTLDKRGLKLLYAVAWPPQGIYAKKELKSAADMTARSMSTFGRPSSSIAMPSDSYIHDCG